MVSANILLMSLPNSFPTTISGPIEVGYNQGTVVAKEMNGFVKLVIVIKGHFLKTTPRPFTLSVHTEDGTASMFLEYYR